MEGAGGTGGPGCGARVRWRGLAGQRADAPSEACSADGSRAGRRPRRSTAQQGAPSGRARRCPENQWCHKEHRRWAAAHGAARPSRAHQGAGSEAGLTARPDGARNTCGTHSNARIQPECPASRVARWTPPRPASWAAWVRHEKPSARYTASGCADRDGSRECDATATDRS